MLVEGTSGRGATAHGLARSVPKGLAVRSNPRVLSGARRRYYCLAGARRHMACQVPLRASKSKGETVSAQGAEAGTEKSGGKDAAARGAGSGFLSGIVRSLRDFGVRRRSIWEGGVGLFIITSFGATYAILSWILGSQPGRYLNSYKFTVAFPVAYGMTIGTPVRMRGVNVGSVVGIQPSLRAVDTVVEIKDQSIVIPKNSEIVINQLGLIAETMVDITPGDDLPTHEAGPLDAGCDAEGALVCHRSKLEGEQGVSMDEFLMICTKLAKQMDKGGLSLMLDAADKAMDMFERGKPLLKEATVLAKEITPILEELRTRDVVGSVKDLTESASQAVSDINHMNKVVLTEDNLALLHKSVATLVNTLKNIESISGSVGNLTGDVATQDNIKQLIQSLSRIIVD